MSDTERAVLNLLMAREAIDNALAALTGDAMPDDDEPDDVPEPVSLREPGTASTCAHPKHLRQPIGGFGAKGANDWRCKGCGHIHEEAA